MIKKHGWFNIIFDMFMILFFTLIGFWLLTILIAKINNVPTCYEMPEIYVSGDKVYQFVGITDNNYLQYKNGDVYLYVKRKEVKC